LRAFISKSAQQVVDWRDDRGKQFTPHVPLLTDYAMAGMTWITIIQAIKIMILIFTAVAYIHVSQSIF